jgi:hypothetical protein
MYYSFMYGFMDVVLHIAGRLTRRQVVMLAR